MKISIFLTINVIFSCFAQTNDFNYKKLIYDENLSNVNVVNIPFDEKFDCKALNKKINLFLIEGNKIRMDKIKFSDYTFLPKHWNSQYIKSDLSGFCFGTKMVLNNNLILYSEDFENNSLKNKYGVFLTTGVILIENNGFIKSWVKFFESEIDSEFFLESYIFDNYIILIQTIDSGYDVFVKGQNKNIKYKYLVFKVLLDGNIQKLNEIESKKIKIKYLSR